MLMTLAHITNLQLQLGELFIFSEAEKRLKIKGDWESVYFADETLEVHYRTSKTCSSDQC